MLPITPSTSRLDILAGRFATTFTRYEDLQNLCSRVTTFLFGDADDQLIVKRSTSYEDDSSICQAAYSFASTLGFVDTNPGEHFYYANLSAVSRADSSSSLWCHSARSSTDLCLHAVPSTGIRRPELQWMHLL